MAILATFVLTPGDNIYVSSYYYNQNFYGASCLFCGQYAGSGDIYRSLLSFDMGSIPASCSINEAKLKLFISRNDAPAVVKRVNVFAALDGFSEYTVTYANQPLISPSPASSVTVTAELNTYLEFDVTDLVRGWYTGSVPNNGIIVTGVENASDLVAFSSKEHSNSNVWPLLEVNYVKGINMEYPVENVTTGDTWAGSSAIPLGPRTVSFAVVNTGDTNDAAVGLEISPDGVAWAWVAFLTTGGVIILTPLPASGYTGDSTLVINTTGYTGAYARITYTCRTGHGPTTLSIYPISTEF